MLQWFKDNTTRIGSKAAAENPELIQRGIFMQADKPEYCTEYDKIVEQAMAAAKA
jgi:2-oxoglutarate ferredoxin oxidoreductase subunit beta